MIQSLIHLKRLFAVLIALFNAEWAMSEFKILLLFWLNFDKHPAHIQGPFVQLILLKNFFLLFLQSQKFLFLVVLIYVFYLLVQPFVRKFFSSLYLVATHLFLFFYSALQKSYRLVKSLFLSPAVLPLHSFFCTSLHWLTPQFSKRI